MRENRTAATPGLKTSATPRHGGDGRDTAHDPTFLPSPSPHRDMPAPVTTGTTTDVNGPDITPRYRDGILKYDIHDALHLKFLSQLLENFHPAEIGNHHRATDAQITLRNRIENIRTFRVNHQPGGLDAAADPASSGSNFADLAKSGISN